jgi:hypothetical protein
MPDYRRAWYPGGTYFFTVNLLQRQGNDLLTRQETSGTGHDIPSSFPTREWSRIV